MQANTHTRTQCRILLNKLHKITFLVRAEQANKGRGKREKRGKQDKKSLSDYSVYKQRLKLCSHTDSYFRISYSYVIVNPLLPAPAWLPACHVRLFTARRIGSVEGLKWAWALARVGGLGLLCFSTFRLCLLSVCTTHTHINKNNNK